MKNFFIKEEFSFFVLLYTFIKKGYNTNINLYSYEDFTH